MGLETTLNIFCCYAREDRAYVDTLRAHLSPLQRQRIIQVWHEGDINAGEEWDQALRSYLLEAHIIVLLLSADFIQADYCYSVAMQQALSRHKQRQAVVIPVLLRPVSFWEMLPPGDIQLGQLHPLPTNRIAITSWLNADAAWDHVAGEIGKVAQMLLKWLTNQQPSPPPYQDTKVLSPQKLKFTSPGEKTRVLDTIPLERLVYTLMDAFPSTREIKLLIAYKLQQNREVIAAGNDLEEQIHALVTWAARNGKMDVLLAGALERNPGNAKLRTLATEYGLIP